MKNKYYVLAVVFLTISLVLGVSACSDDNSTGPEEEINCSSMSLPSQLVQAQVTTDYFQSNDYPNESPYLTYNTVKTYAIGGSASISGSFEAATSYLTLAQGFGLQPEANDGSCNWTFDASAFVEGDLSIQVNSTPVSDGVEWVVTIDGNFDDQEVSDYKYIEGFISTDGKTGYWSGYSPEDPNTAQFTYTWEIESEESYEATLESQSGTDIEYTRDGSASNNMIYYEGSSETELFWNEDDDSGWIEASGETRACYENFEDSAC